MKTNITLSLDRDIVDDLQREDNYSNLVNEQMKAFFNIKSLDSIAFLKSELKKIKQILKENKKKKREIEAQMEKIRKKEKKTLENSKKIMILGNRDPVTDPDLWKNKGWDRDDNPQHKKIWKAHLEFMKGGDDEDE